MESIPHSCGCLEISWGPLEGSIACLNLEHQSVLRLERGSTIKLCRLLWQRVLVNYRGNLITRFPRNWFPFKCVETSLDMHLLLELMGIDQILGAVCILERRQPSWLYSEVHLRGFFSVRFPSFLHSFHSFLSSSIHSAFYSSNMHLHH